MQFMQSLPFYSSIIRLDPIEIAPTESPSIYRIAKSFTRLNVIQCCEREGLVKHTSVEVSIFIFRKPCSVFAHRLEYNKVRITSDPDVYSSHQILFKYSARVCSNIDLLLYSRCTPYRLHFLK